MKSVSETESSPIERAAKRNEVSSNASDEIPRREFLKRGIGATTAVAALSGFLPATASAAEPRPIGKMIGMQIGAVSFVDEGVGPVLDLLHERAAVDTIFLTTFTYGRGLGG